MPAATTEQITTSECDALKQEHRPLGNEPKCKACAQAWPCTTERLLARINTFEDGCRELQRRLVFYSSPDTMQNALKVCRKIVSDSLHGSG